MAGIAKITLVGNLGRDPETRYTPNGKMNVTFTMAVSRRFNDQSGQQQERTNWYRVTAWGELAEIARPPGSERLPDQGQAGLCRWPPRSARVPGSAGADANVARRDRQRAAAPWISRRRRGRFRRRLRRRRGRRRCSDGRRAARTRKTSPGRSRKSPGTTANHRSEGDGVTGHGCREEDPGTIRRVPSPDHLTPDTRVATRGRHERQRTTGAG